MTSIGDLNSQMLVNNLSDGMDRNAGSSRSGQSGDFKSAFANATGQINVKNRDIQTETNKLSGDRRESAAASAEKKPYDKSDVKSEKSLSDDNVSKSDTQGETAVKDESNAVAETGKNDADDTVLDEKEIEAVLQAVDVIIEKTAEILNVDVSEIMKACEDLEISASDLVMSENMNMLAANILGDGGLESLLTDQSILEAAGELNKMAAEILEDAGFVPAEIGEILDTAVVSGEDAQVAGTLDEAEYTEVPVQTADFSGDAVPAENAVSAAQSDNLLTIVAHRRMKVSW